MDYCVDFASTLKKTEQNAAERSKGFVNGNGVLKPQTGSFFFGSVGRGFVTRLVAPKKN